MSTDLSDVPTEQLEIELNKRIDKKIVHCSTCGKWTTYLGCSDSWQRKLHCFGCRKPVENCICSH